MTDLLHVENMRVSQARVHLADVRWYVVTANGGIVAGPYERKIRANAKLALIRHTARNEAKEEAARDARDAA